MGKENGNQKIKKFQIRFEKVRRLRDFQHDSCVSNIFSEIEWLESFPSCWLRVVDKMFTYRNVVISLPNVSSVNNDKDFLEGDKVKMRIKSFGSRMIVNSRKKMLSSTRLISKWQILIFPKLTSEYFLLFSWQWQVLT